MNLKDTCEKIASEISLAEQVSLMMLDKNRSSFELEKT